MDGEREGQLGGASGQYAETDRSFWMMIHLATTPSVLDKKLASNVNSLDQFFIAHYRNCHNMTAEEEMGEEELE